MGTAGWRFATRSSEKPAQLQHSTRLPGTSGLRYYLGYDWASDVTLLQVDTGAPPGPCAVNFRQVVTGASPPSLAFPRGQETGLTGESLTHISPNRRWVLFTGFTSHTVVALTGAPRSYQVKLDFPSVLNQSNPVPVCAAWMPDSSHWLELTQDKQGGSAILLHKLNGSVERRLPFIQKATWHLLVGVTYRNTALIEMNLAPDRQPPQIKLFEIDLQTGVLREHNGLEGLKELRGSDCMSLALSPQGDRLAWVTRTGRSPLSSLHRVIGGKSPITRYTLYTAFLDGAQLTAVDSVDSENREEMAQTHWTPDGKRISFVFNEAIYTVPVPTLPTRE